MSVVFLFPTSSFFFFISIYISLPLSSGPFKFTYIRSKFQYQRSKVKVFFFHFFFWCSSSSIVAAFFSFFYLHRSFSLFLSFLLSHIYTMTLLTFPPSDNTMDQANNSIGRKGQEEIAWLCVWRVREGLHSPPACSQPAPCSQHEAKETAKPPDHEHSLKSPHFSPPVCASTTISITHSLPVFLTFLFLSTLKTPPLSLSLTHITDSDHSLCLSFTKALGACRNRLKEKVLYPSSRHRRRQQPQSARETVGGRGGRGEEDRRQTSELRGTLAAAGGTARHVSPHFSLYSSLCECLYMDGWQYVWV